MKRSPARLLSAFVGLVALGGLMACSSAVRAPLDLASDATMPSDDASPDAPDAADDGPGSCRHPNRGQGTGICSSDADCGGQHCYLLTAYAGICDERTVTPVSDCPTGLDTGNDECGCRGLNCAGAQICKRVRHACPSCQNLEDNLCVDQACAAPADCAGDTVCTPPILMVASGQRCMTLGCRTDADCTAGPCGACTLSLYSGLSGPLTATASCLYPSVPTTCAQGTYADFNPVYTVDDPAANYYRCR